MPRRHDSLTEADLALLERLASGEKDKKMAGELGISQSALTRRIERAADILGAKTRCQAVAMYVRKTVLNSGS